MDLEKLTIGEIREAQALCKEQCKTIGEWKKYWREFGVKYGLTDHESLKVAQDRI